MDITLLKMLKVADSLIKRCRPFYDLLTLHAKVLIELTIMCVREIIVQKFMPINSILLSREEYRPCSKISLENI